MNKLLEYILIALVCPLAYSIWIANRWIVSRLVKRKEIQRMRNNLKLKDIIYLFNKFEKAKFVFVKNENGNLAIDKNRESIIGTLEDIYYSKNIKAPNMYVRHVAFLNYWDVSSQGDNQYLTFFLEDKDEQSEKDKKEK